MSYKFAIQKEVTFLNQWCLDILHEVQEDIKDYFTFDIRLIGSGDKRLVTQNSDQSFDLDYNLILQKDKKDLINNPQRIKDIFIKSFKYVLKQRDKNYSHVCYSTSVITAKIIINKKMVFSFDVAIIVEGDDGYFYRLTNDKNSNHYIWNRVPSSKDYFEKFQWIKKQGYWKIFKDRYLELKNMHLKRGEDIKSFSIFLETLNEFVNNYGR